MRTTTDTIDSLMCVFNHFDGVEKKTTISSFLSRPSVRKKHLLALNKVCEREKNRRYLRSWFKSRPGCVVEAGQRLQIRQALSIPQLDIRRGENATDIVGGGPRQTQCVKTCLRAARTLASMSVLVAHRQPGGRRTDLEPKRKNQKKRTVLRKEINSSLSRDRSGERGWLRQQLIR